MKIFHCIHEKKGCTINYHDEHDGVLLCWVHTPKVPNHVQFPCESKIGRVDWIVHGQASGKEEQKKPWEDKKAEKLQNTIIHLKNAVAFISWPNIFWLS